MEVPVWWNELSCTQLLPKEELHDICVTVARTLSTETTSRAKLQKLYWSTAQYVQYIHNDSPMLQYRSSKPYSGGQQWQLASSVRDVLLALAQEHFRCQVQKLSIPGQLLVDGVHCTTLRTPGSLWKRGEDKEGKHPLSHYFSHKLNGPAWGMQVLFHGEQEEVLAITPPLPASIHDKPALLLSTIPVLLLDAGRRAWADSAYGGLPWIIHDENQAPIRLGRWKIEATNRRLKCWDHFKFCRTSLNVYWMEALIIAWLTNISLQYHPLRKEEVEDDHDEEDETQPDL
eukprot:TRINITY_DN112877_c0_g1_i1.p1 TRINITY_DN112877_c0_g1~~TRINITY_DN112877_c0_g1_i1.p1  ORF type:complete len:307 (-),score=10.55 TRINITY_DN112877_c0_g1_i1:71-931(-)